TFWKRGCPPASLDVFNAPTRESTTPRRDRTNTPMQALVLLNDPQFVEAARHIAVNSLRDAAGSIDATLDSMGVRVIGRPLDVDEHVTLTASFQAALAHFTSDPDAAGS